MKRFALAGNPNCGKTTLFNALTGATAHVGNWPGVTVDKKEGVYKKLPEPVSIIDLPGIYSLSPYTPEEVISRNYILDEKPSCVINIVDATNLERNLYLTTQILEMDVPVVVALNMYDLILKNGEVIDVDLLSKELGVKVVPISAMKGDSIKELMEVAFEEADKKRKGETTLKNTEVAPLINELVSEYQKLEVSNPLFHAIKLIEDDSIEKKLEPGLVKAIDNFKENFDNELFKDDLEAYCADKRYDYITSHYQKAKEKKVEEKDKLSRSDKIDKILTHKWLGLPIFALVLYLIFRLTFAENLFWINADGAWTPSFQGSIFEGLFWTDSGINGPGVIINNFFGCILDWLSGVIRGWFNGAPGWVTGLFNDGIIAGVFAVLGFLPQILVLFLFFAILEDSGYMARVAFILDKIFRKFGLTGRAFMPMIMGFGCSVPAMINTRTLITEKERTATIRVIPFFSCGAKMPILAGVAGAICSVFGGGQYAWAISMGMYLFGTVVAFLTLLIMHHTVMRGLDAPFVMELPEYHAPQFKSLMLHLWDKAKHYVKKAFTVILASTIIIWFLQSFTWNWHYIEQANPSDFLVESYETMASAKEDTETNEEYQARIARFSDINPEYVVEDEVVVDYETFVADFDELSSLETLSDEETLTLEKYDNLYSDILLDAYNNYKDTVTSPDYLDANSSILAGIGQLVQPIFTPLGFGSNLNENGWVYGVSAVTGLVAKEAVISTFATLAQCIESIPQDAEEFQALVEVSSDSEEGVLSVSSMIVNTNMVENGGWAALIAFIAFNLLTIPCFAAVATARGELSKKKFRNTVIFWMVSSYVISSIVFVSLRWYWPIAIFAGLFVGSYFLIKYINRYRDRKAQLV